MLVIGHFLTRDHYRDRIDELAAERDHWSDAAVTAGDPDADLDFAEFDAVGGFGVGALGRRPVRYDED